MIQRGKLLFRNLFPLLLLTSCATSSALLSGEPPQQPQPVISSEIRVVDAEGRILLSQGGVPLAVAMIRPLSPENAVPAVLDSNTAKTLLSKKDVSEALKQGSEQLRNFRYPLQTGNAADQLDLLLRIRKMSAGARLTVIGNVSGPSQNKLAPGEHLRPAAPLELAIQIFSGADGKLPDTFYIDDVREGLNLNVPFARRARSWSFENKKDFKVKITRSGPTDWLVQQLADSIILRTRLLPDPREPAGLGSSVTYIGTNADDAPPEISPLYLDKTQTPARDFVDGWVRVYASGANPLFLTELAVIAEIAMPPKPNGDIPIKRLPCYFWEPPTSFPAEGEFHFRFAPPAEGIYGARIVVVTNTGQVNGDAVEIRAGPPATPGFVRIHNNERMLRFDDHSVFIPRGFELHTPGKADVELYRRFFAELARQGGNTARLTLTTALLPLDKQPVGAFDPDVAAALDDIFRAAQVRGIFLIVGLENAADISKGSAHHPYFREMHGPLSATSEFFHDAVCKKLFQNRLTYIAARYGAYRSVLAWDILDSVDKSWPILETDWEDKKLTPNEADLSRRAHRDVEDWTDEMALHIRGVDQHSHPICISTAADPRKPWLGLEKVEHLDWVIHSPGSFEKGDASAIFPALAAAARGPGRVHRLYMLDRAGAEFPPHDLLFSTLAGGFCGAPLLRVDDPAMIANVSEFTSAVEFCEALSNIAEYNGREEMSALNEQLMGIDKSPVKLLGLARRYGVCAWIIAKSGGKNSEAVLKLPGLQEGTYDIRWLDSHTGRILSRDSHTAPARQVDHDPEPFNLKTPPFQQDVILLITRSK